MSVILITHHNENIYNITKEARRYVKKSPRYKSKYASYEHKYPPDPYLLTQYTIKKYGTMGKLEETPPDPCNFLRKKSGLQKQQRNSPIKCELHKARIKEQKEIPTLEEAKQYDEERQKRSKKNFIANNIKYAIKMKPKDPARKIVINKYGESKPLAWGLEPIYIKNPVYGRTPQYLETFIKIHQKHYQEQKDSVGLEQPKCRYITREEREQLLNGLKQNWEELQKQYQGLPILTDTIPKTNRKAKMEADLKQLEKDIVLIERHPYIYVYDDDEELNQ